VDRLIWAGHLDEVNRHDFQTKIDIDLVNDPFKFRPIKEMVPENSWAKILVTTLINFLITNQS
jgi:hypothetical protein